MREDMKTQIADTFSELLEKEDIDKITVTQLIEECQISRQTFYYHFHDIMDVLEWTFKRSTQILVQRSLESQDRIGALKEYLSFVRLHHRKLKRLVDSKEWFQIEGMMVDAVQVYLEKVAQGKISDLRLSYEDVQVMLRFFACGMVGVLFQHIDRQTAERGEAAAADREDHHGENVPRGLTAPAGSCDPFGYRLIVLI